MAIEIRPLRPTDDRSAFSCGEPALDRFFEHYAGQNQFKLKLAVTYVALAQRDTAGCLGVVTDAKPDAVALYEKLGFVPLEGLREGRLHGDPTPMFLDIHALAAALDG